MRSLFINGNIIDLSESSEIAVTYQANDVGSLQNRQGTFTNNFKIIQNDHNVSVLGFSNLMTSASLVPYLRLNCTYIENGVEIISDGYGILKDSSNNFFTLQIVSGNIDLSKSIGDKLIGEFYSNDTVYKWNTENAFNSLDGSRYYIYPLIDWRADIDTFFNTSPVADVSNMLPAIKIPDLFSRIEADLGFSFVGPYLESEEHKTMILTPDEFTRSDESINALKAKATFDPSGYYESIIDSFIIPEDSGINYGRVYPKEDTFETGFSLNNFSVTQNSIGSLSLTDNLFISWRKNITGPLYFYQERDFYIVSRIIRASDGQVLAEVTSEVWTGDLDQPDPDFYISFETGNILFEAGDSYYAAHDFVISAHGNVDSIMKVRTGYTKFEYTPTSIIAIGSNLDFKDIFRMKTKDVLFDILNLRGVIIQTDTYKKEVQFNYFQDIVDNIPSALDWSDKVDIRSNNLSFRFGDYSQKNWFKFKEADSVPKGLGDYYFLIENENLEAEKTIIQLNHSATEQKNKYLGYNIPEIKAFDSAVKWLKPGYRLLNLEKQNTSFSVSFSDGTTTQTTSSNIPFARFYGFDQTIPEFYTALIGILDKTKALKIPLHLSEDDVSNVDFTIPIYLHIPERSIDGYFYLNKIENFTSGLTLCEFIRL
jgi:hypothetical protein